MNLGKDFQRALAQIKANAALRGQTLYMTQWGLYYWQSNTKPNIAYAGSWSEVKADGTVVEHSQ